MIGRRVKCLLVAAFSLFSLIVSAQGQSHHDKHVPNRSDDKEKQEETKKFDANEVIFGHVLDAHQYHFFTYKGQHFGISLPVLLYAPERGGFHSFSSAQFHHGEHEYKGFQLVTQEYKESLVREHGYSEEQIKGLSNESIIAVNENGTPAKDVKVYDFSLTRNVVQM